MITTEQVNTINLFPTPNWTLLEIKAQRLCSTKIFNKYLSYIEHPIYQSHIPFLIILKTIYRYLETDY